MDVGFDLLGPLGRGDSLVPSWKGDGKRVDRDDAERHADKVKECSSAAVANRDSNRSPLCESRSSCRPTVHPDRYVGSEYAMAAVMLVALVRNERDMGGHAVCERNEYRSLGGSKAPVAFGVLSNAYRDNR
jgi:hypothetical protein